MSKVITAKANDVFRIMDQIFDHEKTSWVVVTGMSMFPFLREDVDMVEMARTKFSNIKKGDIVLAQRQSGEYVMHRVYKKSAFDFFLLGDAQQWIEGPLFEDQLKAVVVSIKRDNRMISCNNYFLRLLSFFWMTVRPIRYKLFKVYAFIMKCI
ncbi:MAG: peptidase [Firmicutes bacterium]|nr:peptidase [Bacillota bacterium]